MQLILYSNFSKRKNSTKRPSGGTEHTVRLKDGCSIENPVFLIDGIDLTVNYAKWNESYYFITDIILSNNNIYEIHCEMDVLATWKETIGASTQFVERSSSQYNVDIPDTYLSSSQKISRIDTAETSWGQLGLTGCYILRTISTRGIRLYACSTLSVFSAVYTQVITPDPGDAEQIEEYGVLATSFGKRGLAMLNITDYLGGVFWVPFSASSLGDRVYTLSIGMYGDIINVGDSYAVYEITNPSRGSTFDLNLPQNIYSDFRAHSPQYSQYSLSLPGVGMVSLDPLLTRSSNTLYIAMNVDLETGAINYRLYCNTEDITGTLVAEWNGQIGLQIPIGQMSTNGASLVSSVVGAISGIAGGIASGGVAGIVSAITVGVGNTFDIVHTALTPTANISGGNGDRASALIAIRCTVINYETAEYATSFIGRPLYRNKKISDLSGFIKCAGASLDVGGVSSEKDIINSYLNGGFYYE